MDENKIIITAEPELFPPQELKKTQPQQEHKQTTVEDIFKHLGELRELTEKTGIYVTLPTEALVRKAEQVYNDTAEKLTDLLTSTGASAEIISKVNEDYARLLVGSLDFTATPKQIAEALKYVKPHRAYMLDKYGVYLGLFLTYSRYYKILTKYVTDVQDTTTATDETKEKFITEGTFLPMHARALKWLRDKKIFTPEDFVNVERGLLATSLDNIENGGNVADYCTYYTIAKGLLRATDEELDEITPPPLGTQKPLKEYAEGIFKFNEEQLTKAAEKFAEAIEATNREEQEQAAREARKWEPAPLETVRIPENVGLILSRDIFVSPDGAQVHDILPISAYIADFMSRSNYGGALSPRTVEKAIEGVNMLQRFKNVKPVNGYYEYRTNLSEFSALCGYKDANQDEKKELLQALLMLHNLYLVVWRASGLAAVQVLNVPEIGLSGVERENIKIMVPTRTMNRHPILVNAQGFEELKKRAKGQAANHFRNQILTKGHKNEDDLLDEVFGYSYRIKELELNHDTEGIKAFKTEWRKHKARNRNKLQQWFEEYRAQGAIKYEKKTNANNEVIYSWKPSGLLNPTTPNPDAVEVLDEPDEQ